MSEEQRLTPQEFVDMLNEGGWVVSHVRVVKHWALRTGIVVRARLNGNQCVVTTGDTTAPLPTELIYLTHPWVMEVREEFAPGRFRFRYRFFNQSIADDHPRPS